MRISRPLQALILALGAFVAAPSAQATPIQIYGVWHAGNDACIWGSVRTIEEFDEKNHWIVDRGDSIPSVNLVILSFIEPQKLLHKTTDAATLDGVPRGMTQEIVDYFTSRGIRVMISIGGITYVNAWEAALAEDATQLGLEAAAVATRLGVGIEIDYEGSSATSVEQLQQFVDAYRSVHPYDATGADPTARLTVDLAAGDRWLIELCRKATRDWLDVSHPVLDYANAMVPSRQPSATKAIANWQEHVDGKPQYGPPIPPLAPSRFTGGLYVSDPNVTAECTNFTGSVHYATRDFVENVAPNGAGTTPGMLGYMFWSAECPSSRGDCTTPPNSCTGGLGVGSQYFDIGIPMPALRQDGTTVGVPVLPSHPATFALFTPIPNPIRTTSLLRFALPADARVDLRLYDVAGREVSRLASGVYPAGTNTITLERRDRAPGTYFCRLVAETNGRTLTTSVPLTILR